MNNVEIRKIKPLEHEKFKAKIDVVFQTTEFGPIVVKGFRVAQSKFDGVWVEPPSYQVWGSYFKCFFIENLELWRTLKKTIIDACVEKGVELDNNVRNEDVRPEEVKI